MEINIKGNGNEDICVVLGYQIHFYNSRNIFILMEVNLRVNGKMMFRKEKDK